MIYINILFATLALSIGYLRCQKNSETITFYRKDYDLIENVFYKYHDEAEDVVTWHQAKEICELEGATLFYPANENEMNTLLDWLKLKTDKSEYMHIGVYNNVTGDVVTVDDQPFDLEFDGDSIRDNNAFCLLLRYPLMTMTRYECDAEFKFVCKRSQASVQWNNACDMAVLGGNDYEYNSKLNKCYKLHTIPKTWHEAVKVCKAEQSILTEIDSLEEAEHLMEIVKRVPEEEVGVVCLGFKIEYDGWRMLSGPLLRDSGYTLWAHTQPDGPDWEQCGAMAYNGRLHDIDCASRCLFVCEHDIHTSSF